MRGIKTAAAALVLAAALFALTGGSVMKSTVGFDALVTAGVSSVIGRTGMPLGEVTTVEGVVIDGSETRAKEDEGRLMMRVRSVNGKALPRETVIPLLFFSWAGVKSPAAGEKKKYAGYETGGFTGIPDKAFDLLPRVATSGFHFETAYQVCREL